MKIGAMRITTKIHPDSVNVRIWEVEHYLECKGKYANPGDCYWSSCRLANNGPIEPFTSRDSAIEYGNPSAVFDS